MKRAEVTIQINTPRNRHIWNHAQRKCRSLSGPEFH